MNNLLIKNKQLWQTATHFAREHSFNTNPNFNSLVAKHVLFLPKIIRTHFFVTCTCFWCNQQYLNLGHISKRWVLSPLLPASRMSCGIFYSLQNHNWNIIFISTRAEKCLSSYFFRINKHSNKTLILDWGQFRCWNIETDSDKNIN